VKPVELEHQLDAYGRWIEARYITGLRPVPPVAAPDSEEPPRVVDLDDLSPGRRRRSIVVAAAALVLIGMVGTALVLRPDAAPASISVPRDPPGPLFILPRDRSVPISDGQTAMLQTDVTSTSSGYGATVGRPVEGGFEDIASIMTGGGVDTSRDWVVGQHGGFPTWTFDHDFTVVAQDRGDWWITVQSGADRIDAVFDVLDHVTATAGGEIGLNGASTRVIIDQARVGIGEVESSVAIWTATLGGAQLPNVFVQTLSMPAPLLLTLGRVERIEPTTIKGVRAWRTFSRGDPALSDSGQTELVSAVQWSYSPNRTVTVGGSTDIGTLERFAATLEQVTAEEWAAALPGFTAECTMDDVQLCDALPDS
jgi:hypothetical protein